MPHWLTLDGYLLWIGVGTATLIFLYWLGRAVRWAWSSMRAAWARFVAMADLLDEQLKPNHGSSLIDRVSAIRDVQTQVQAIATTQTEQHEEAREHWSHLHEADDKSEKEVAGLREDVGRFRVDLDDRAAQLAVRIDGLANGQDTLGRRFDEGQAFWNQLLEVFLSGVFGPDMERVGQYVRKQIEAATPPEAK